MPRYGLVRRSASLVQTRGPRGAWSRDMPVQSSKGTTGRKPAAPRLSRERRHVLQILARSGHLGVTEATMMAYGLSTAMLAGMACDGFVTVVVDTIRAGDRTIKVRWLRITDTGRKVIEH
jgi:hypothetical protein